MALVGCEWPGPQLAGNRTRPAGQGPEGIWLVGAGDLDCSGHGNHRNGRGAGVYNVAGAAQLLQMFRLLCLGRADDLARKPNGVVVSRWDGQEDGPGNSLLCS